ncbi:MAG TPA: DUF3515 family protein [Rugosimonospora sp.]|nr:DUF3515 family protein [Rugosimonospora sp.]
MADEVTRRAARLALLIALPVALVAGLVAFWALGGFHPARAPGPVSTAPVAMPTRSLPASAATTCLAFIAHLPAALRGLAQRPVAAGPEQNAAYGDPPIEVGCGGWPVPSIAADTQLWTLSGICWYADQSGATSTTWITLDRQTPVRVTVPDSYQGQGDWVQEFSAPIVQWVPSLAQPPKQCQAPATAPS